jgi:hypothetical protein
MQPVQATDAFVRINLRSLRQSLSEPGRVGQEHPCFVQLAYGERMLFDCNAVGCLPVLQAAGMDAVDLTNSRHSGAPDAARTPGKAPARGAICYATQAMRIKGRRP